MPEFRHSLDGVRFLPVDLQRILMISASPGADRDRWGVRAPKSIEHASWNDVDVVPDVALVLAVGADDEPRSIAFLRGLIARKLRCPCIAILPANPSAELLQSSAGADDILLQPVQEDELRWRIERLIGLQAVKTKLIEEVCLRGFITQ